jgi:hypothetical protein
MSLSGKRSGYRHNLALAKRLWSGRINRERQHALKSLSDEYGLSVAAGDLQLLDSHWYVTHTGLIRLAQRKGCSGITVNLMTNYCESASSHWVFKATVYKSPVSRGFVGYGDADPTNTSPLVRGAEMRVAETRAVNRALRKAYGIGLCSVEELGWLTNSPSPPGERVQSAKRADSNGSSNGQPKLRDRLCVLIRQHNLDPILVKAYAADFCGTPTIKDATRDLVESFISHLATAANENRDGLVRKLNSYSQPVEVKL